MPPTKFDESLLNLKGGSVQVVAVDGPWEFGSACIQLLFQNGSMLRADYWRVSKDGRASLSSFDHNQQYGLPAPINAISELEEHLRTKVLLEARLDGETGDLLFRFTQDIKLQVLNVSGYEVWEIKFPDGTGEYSNYAK
jgi:hypothetical protein